MKFLAVIIICSLSFVLLKAQTLWKDHNPYDSSPTLKKNTILKLVVDEPIKIEYEFEDHRDLNTTVKLVPDKTISKFLKPVDSSRSITTKNKGRLLSKNRVVFEIAVNVTGDVESEIVEFKGSKVIAQESGKQQQQIQISGKILKSDISSDRRIKSKNVANLVISISGAPLPITKNLSMQKDEEGKPVAKIGDAQKQKMIMDYINRVLGESSNRR